MRGVPLDLIFALLFGAVLLIQYLFRALRRKAASMQAQRDAELQPATAPSTPSQAPPDVAMRRSAVHVAVPPPINPPSPPPPRVMTRTAPRARRFSRAALMPDRRAVQNAVVMAAILQPCHAHKARDIE